MQHRRCISTGPQHAKGRAMTLKIERPQAMTSTDRIEKQLLIRAPRAKVWRALADAQAFGEWFRMKLDGPFVEGKTVNARVTHPGYEHMKVEMQVERIEPERYFAYRWHPYPNDP